MPCRRDQQLANSLQQFNITAVDYVAVATYMSLPTDFSIASAMVPAGATVSNAGSWPVDAINDLFRYWMAYSQAIWGTGRATPSIARAWSTALRDDDDEQGGSSAGTCPLAPITSATRSWILFGRETTLGFSEKSLTVTSPAIFRPWRCRRGPRGLSR